MTLPVYSARNFKASVRLCSPCRQISSRMLSNASDILPTSSCADSDGRSFRRRPLITMQSSVDSFKYNGEDVCRVPHNAWNEIALSSKFLVFAFLSRTVSLCCFRIRSSFSKTVAVPRAICVFVCSMEFPLGKQICVEYSWKSEKFG